MQAAQKRSEITQLVQPDQDIGVQNGLWAKQTSILGIGQFRITFTTLICPDPDMVNSIRWVTQINAGIVVMILLNTAIEMPLPLRVADQERGITGEAVISIRCRNPQAIAILIRCVIYISQQGCSRSGRQSICDGRNVFGALRKPCCPARTA